MSTPTPTARRQGDSTREALILAAIDVFGRYGFDGASTRAIAEAAGVNQALIGYHFGGKSGLYLAAFEHIASIMQQRLGPIVTAIHAELEAAPSDPGASAISERCLAAIHRLTDGLVAILSSDVSAAWARLIIREQQSPSEGFDILYNAFMSRVLDTIGMLIGRIRDTDPASIETRLTVLTIIGQALVFRAARAAVMRQTEWQTLGHDELALIQATIRNNTTAILMQESPR